MDVVDNSTDKEDSNAGKNAASREKHAADEDVIAASNVAVNSAITLKPQQHDQVPVDRSDNDDDVEMETKVDIKNAGIQKKLISSNPIDSEYKMANLKVLSKITHNDTLPAAALTPSTESQEDQSQSPSSLRIDGGESQDKTQSPSCLTSPVASTTPVSTPASSPPGGEKPGNSSGGDSPPLTGDRNSKVIPQNTTSPSQHQKLLSTVQQTPSNAVVADGANCIQQPINIVRNGTIPNAGKPLMSTMSKKLEKSAKATRTRKPKSSVAMYESEISENKIGIKLCIKKSDSSLSAATAAAIAAVTKGINKSATSTSSRSRKSSRSQKQRMKLQPDSHDEGDEVDYEPRRKKDRNTTKRQTSTTATVGAINNEWEDQRPVVDQSIWGSQLPEPVLSQIFQYVVNQEGCLPTLLRLGRVCSLWRRVSLSPMLWKTMDLSTWIKEKYRTELKLKWFVDNRCTCCSELNVSNWKVSDINCFLLKLSAGAPNLTSITLSGWKGFTCDHLTYLVENMKKLERLDLSSVNVEMNASKSAVGLQSLCNAMQVMGERLTHLYLAHNRLAGIPQLVNVLSTHCPNLVILDLSNVTTQATSHGILHVEKLQQGCPKLKVLRITNSHITLSTASLQEQMDSPGFSELEELSVAVTDESRVIGDEHIQRILKTSSKLKLLDVRGCARLTHESLIRLPAWDIKHLFLSGCSVTRDMGSGLELIASKWAHSLIELDLAWANVQHPLDNALRALADKRADSRLAHLNLCGSSVSEEAVKEILANCPLMSTINLASCRGLPRGVKRQMQGPKELNELRDALKVQLKVKLPQTETTQTNLNAVAMSTSANTSDCGGGGGGGGGGSNAAATQSP